MKYRLLNDIGAAGNRASKGTILFAPPSMQPKDGRLRLTANPRGFGPVVMASRAEAALVTTTTHEDFDALFQEFYHGMAPVPNFQWVKTGLALNSLASSGLAALNETGHVRLPGSDRTRWARGFQNFTQGGQFDGTGYLIIYQPTWGDQPAEDEHIARFAICKHETIIGTGANPMRGWNPSHCKLCGLNTSVDCGD